MSENELDLLLEEDESEDEDTLENKYLVFSLSDREYGIEIKYIIEIIGMQPITEVPDMPAFIKGVINLRGKVVPLIDVRLRFHMDEIPYTEKTCVIILNIEGENLGLIVDTVREVVAIPVENTEPAPKMGDGEANRFIALFGKVADSVKILLDVRKLLRYDELEVIHGKIGIS
ncbi:purine-binding chemotaxis protein CheW [Leptospira wolffii]|uniref:Chemotaxis protein CheW n=1 Tax=Leptospira wolffii TaxID=409998 RepID=A0A2M9ZGS5_9LEPT|nr:chemotaxis protein CheW [Leptospira wolffii]PJZ67566.1 chemotaxis protein CheW [Leptospira wolffii]TGK62574.1 purine-binding chemotaxis protein CheW [Leptospira wolffii]TGK70358.1 purine-binding chemotaxis protein CheW [Leptospira wolffii]TGK74041.1 purine-binding chemotaxis protein CheW [Leptospira wolffii]TGL28900.1 purine-binding chemotaxis protein CheW [Leptospira wolffii]